MVMQAILVIVLGWIVASPILIMAMLIAGRFKEYAMKNGDYIRGLIAGAIYALLTAFMLFGLSGATVNW